MNKIKSIVTMVVVTAAAVASLTVAASAATVPTISTNSYNKVNGSWYILEESDDILTFGNTYSPAKYSSLHVYNGVASITGKTYYKGNYKFAMATVRTTSSAAHKSNSGTSTTISNARPSIPDGDVTKATYNAELRNGTSDGSDILDSFIVNVNPKA